MLNCTHYRVLHNKLQDRAELGQVAEKCLAGLAANGSCSLGQLDFLLRNTLVVPPLESWSPYVSTCAIAALGSEDRLGGLDRAGMFKDNC